MVWSWPSFHIPFNVSSNTCKVFTIYNTSILARLNLGTLQLQLSSSIHIQLVRPSVQSSSVMEIVFADRATSPSPSSRLPSPDLICKCTNTIQVQIQIQIHIKKITIVFADRATSHSPSSRFPSTEWNCKYTSCITEEIDMKMELCKPSNLSSPLLNVLLLHPQAAQITLYMLILILTNAH